MCSLLLTNMNHYTMEEIEKQSTWIVVNDKVYDIQSYLTRGLHPGGNDVLKRYGGTDATTDFIKLHSINAHYDLEKYFIGRLKRNNPFDCEKV